MREERERDVPTCGHFVSNYLSRSLLDKPVCACWKDIMLILIYQRDTYPRTVSNVLISQAIGSKFDSNCLLPSVKLSLVQIYKRLVTFLWCYVVYVYGCVCVYACVYTHACAHVCVRDCSYQQFFLWKEKWAKNIYRSISVSLSHTHTHTHTWSFVCFFVRLFVILSKIRV